MALDPRFIEELKNKNDIIDVISRYCTLELKGGNYWARCPLPGHSERTPSFCVNQYGQFFKCFGCGRGGDVISFIMEMESLPYIDAVKYLAEKCDMPLPQSFKEERQTSEEYKKKDTILSILRDTAHFYVANLRSGKAVEHEKYIEKRGLDKKTVTAFGIGASLDFDALPKYLLDKGYTREDILLAGVVSENDFDGAKRLSDFEGKRLIFPIINALGEVIAFGGRALGQVDFGKYKNTRETKFFVKNKTLYNINRIKKMRAQGAIPNIIIVEGYMDTVSLCSAGFENVVASMGTSLTKEQARLIKRYTENVLICYDGDFAGQSANIRGLEILKSEGLNVKVVSLPDGMDPDDVIKKLGAEAYKKCLDEAMPLIDFKLKIVKDKFDDGSVLGKRKYITEAIKIIATSPSEAEREELIRNLSRQMGITYQSLMRDFEKSAESQFNSDISVSEAPVQATSQDDRIVQAERIVLARAIGAGRKPLPDGLNICELEFTDKYRLRMCAYISEVLEAGLQIKPSLLFDYMEDEGRAETEAVIMLYDTPILKEDKTDAFFMDCVKLIKRNSINKKIKTLTLRAEAETQTSARAEIVREIQELSKLIRTL